jgi:hypothetical protein
MYAVTMIQSSASSATWNHHDPIKRIWGALGRHWVLGHIDLQQLATSTRRREGALID